ncbi:hypothetical protein CWI40_050440 [Ordospora colligata]|nr:hypothetical protein CWI40_050440 [Ordospora colligata]
MSLKNQLRMLKMNRRAIHAEVKRRLMFGETEDLDDESILDLIPIKTEYTTLKSLTFDRQRQTCRQEEKFNAKFSKFVRDLVRYGSIKGVEYLFEYLVRRYMCDAFNAKEMMFALLPFKKYYSHVLCLSSRTEFSYFEQQIVYSCQFVGNMCLKDKHFFDFFVGYFDYVKEDDIRVFCEDVLEHVYAGIGRTGKDFSMQFFEIVTCLVDVGEWKMAVDVYNRIKKHVEAACTEFIEVLKPYCDLNSLDIHVNQDDLNGVDEMKPHDENEYFKKMHEDGNGREFLSNMERCKRYVQWMLRENIRDGSYTDFELNMLLSLYGGVNNEIEGQIVDYANLLNEIGDKKRLIERLSNSFGKCIIELAKYMNSDDKAYLTMLLPELWRGLMTDSNHSMVMMSIPKSIFKREIHDIMKMCLGYTNYNAKLFVNELNSSIILILLNECSRDIEIQNIIATSRMIRMDLKPFIISERLYVIPRYLDYLTETCKETNSEASFTIVEELKNEIIKMNTGDRNASLLDSICRYLHHSKDAQSVNQMIGMIIKVEYTSTVFYSMLRVHSEVLTMDTCELVLSMKGIINEVYCILERLYSYKEEVIDECLEEKMYDALVSLCMSKGISTVLNGRKCKEVEEFMKVMCEYDLDDEEMNEYAQYCSILVEYGSKEMVAVLLNEKYMPHLMKCVGIPGWNAAKAILIELIRRHEKSRQWCFEYFVDNSNKFEDELDLFEQIVVDRCVYIDENGFMEMILRSSVYFRCGIMDTVIRNGLFKDLLRYIPYVVPGMIELKVYSVQVFFEKYGRVMGMYVKDVLMKFPEIADCMLNMDSRHLILGGIRAYESGVESGCAEFLHKVINNPGVEVCLQVLKIAEKFVEQNIMDLSSKLIVRIILLCLEKQGELGNDMTELLMKMYETRRKEFFEISNAGFSICSRVFKPYMHAMVENASNNDSEAIVFVTNYLYWDKEYMIEHGKFVRLMFDFYCSEPNAIYAKCIGSLLRHNVDEIQATNDLILGCMKGDRVVMMLELLQVLYQKVYEYKRCLVKSSPYFALVVDSTNKEISKAARKLLKVIEKKHNKTGYQILQS